MQTAPAAAIALAALASLSTGACAQDADIPIRFVATQAAFEEAERTGKRVLVYQDWPG